MNLLFVFGNGLDMNLGLKTGYQDFYDHYLNKVPSSSPLIEKMKNHLSKERYKNWSDLELGLGAYTTEVDSVEDLELIYHDIDDALQSYLKLTLLSFNVDDKMKNNFIKDLQSSYRELPSAASNEIQSFIREYNTYFVNVLSFNYTNVVERILHHNRSNKTLPYPITQNFVVNSIQHIHMSLDQSDIIMGVNDESQILNKALICPDCKGLMVKPYINQRLGSRVDSECKNIIKQTDYFCLFGVSLGETDNMWWKEIGKRMNTSHARLVMYYYDKDKIIYNNHLIRKYDECRELLMNRLDIKNVTPDLESRIYVGYKPNIFH